MVLSNREHCTTKETPSVVQRETQKHVAKKSKEDEGNNQSPTPKSSEDAKFQSKKSILKKVINEMQ